MSNVFSDEPDVSEEEHLPEPSTRERETAIFQVLRQQSAQDGLSVREIAEAAKEYFLNGPSTIDGSLDSSYAHQPKRDTVTVQAYHKLVNRLTALGRLEEAPITGAQGERLYRLAPYIHASNPVTLDDLYEFALQPGAKGQLPPSEVIARIAHAADYLGEKKHIVLKQAAEALTQENPRELFFKMIKYYFEVLKHDLTIYAERGLRDPEVKARIEQEAANLDRLLYRWLSIPPEIVDITEIRFMLRDVDADGKNENHHLQSQLAQHSIRMDEKKLQDFLKKRIFGENFIYPVDAGASRGTVSRKRLTVSGSDGSTHASELQVRTARAFIDENEMMVKFNNAMVYVYESSSAPNRADFPFYSVPITRSALDNPDNRGMIIARQMFPNLSDSVYEHMSRCATDVVQWRVDSKVFSGAARPINPANIYQRNQDFALPAPAVHFRDGTVVPQEREFTHYKRLDEYGDMVREGQNLLRSILQRLREEGNNQVFAGAAKSTQMRVFTQAVSWYIAHGSQDRQGGDGEPIDPSWEEMYAASFSDNQTMTYLLASLVEGSEEQAKAGRYWVSCVVSRPFHATTEFFRREGVMTDEGWNQFFKSLAKREEESAGKEPWLWETQTWENDTFVFLCRRADFGLFYIGHTGGNPPPAIPRYEFVDSLRSLKHEQAALRVAENVRRVVEAIDHTRVAIDADHNFMTNKRLVKIIPYVVHRAHEACKTLGRHLETELRAAVIEQLGRIRRLRGLSVNDFALVPVSLRKFVERMIDSLKDESEEDQEDNWWR